MCGSESIGDAQAAYMLCGPRGRGDGALKGKQRLLLRILTF